MPLVECVPNFSEGRRQEVVNAILEAISTPDVKVLWYDADPDHNRLVVSFAGGPNEITKAAFRGTKKAAELIDMEKHGGEHPRIGATDVIPFIPIRDITLEACAEIATKLGQKIASQLHIPVYLYAAAAKTKGRRNLANIRKGEYEGLKEEIKTNPTRAPDFGPSNLGSAGATVVGARKQELAVNFFLNTDKKDIADQISRRIRASSGGFKGVKALGFEIKERGCVQVSTMIKPSEISLFRVFEIVKSEAQRYGTNVTETEIYGVTPIDPLLEAVIHYLRLNNFSQDQLLEKQVYEW
ncbi:MAG: glutamate formimidoyltransferase [Candidatus Korarchaeota archaeon]|nr:glutamate formimidoyltransferase [Candidatus Korarchaeota archaeon]NIU82558.1 glutamate formimidoyltransferase [Candidatus Thorarchaeota archaeon]NIW13046.1 glutamate formimidoyltransferase [Candidatus Thorarchaeota archaeon]NIW51221.1 glutamate formimidoyltransferase [Candidatus Korarchaeota archaeon]